MNRVEEKYGIKKVKSKPDREADAPPEKAKKGKRAKESSPIITDGLTLTLA